MMTEPFGTILGGNIECLRRAREAFDRQPVDWDLMNGEDVSPPSLQKTIARPVSVSGSGTFLGKATRTITFEPTDMEGWWFDRADLEDDLPVHVSIRNVWTTGSIIRNIVLRSGAPSNYIRMVEHIVALKLGMDIDNLMIRIDSGDPPLFNRGSLDLVEALEEAGTREVDRPVRYFTVTEPVTMGGSNGGFLTLLPCSGDKPVINLDCAIDFPTAIGKQRIRLPLDYRHFKYGSEARTNTDAFKMFYCRTIGKLFADVRNLGYTKDNIVIAGRRGYVNEPRLLHDGRSLEAVWHRATLDLLAAIALIEEGRFAGDVVSYKAGHGLDVRMITKLYQEGMLVERA